MSRLTQAVDMFTNSCVAAGVVWFVFTAQRQLSLIDQHLAAIESKMLDQAKPIDVSLEPFRTLDKALSSEPKKGKHK